MNETEELVKGPLGFPATKDWKYWFPTTEAGKVLAWYCPTLMHDWELLGTFDTIEDAVGAYKEHFNR